MPRREELAGATLRALGLVLRAVDDAKPAALALAQQCHQDRARTRVVALTGAGGVGKSSLIAALLPALLQEHARVAVLAIDPSGVEAGGALLGDRLRLGEVANSERLFYRSLATRGTRGGVSAALSDSVAVLAAAGFGLVVVETAGVGQGDVDIEADVDVVVVVTTPAAGDHVQAMKAGLLEIADLVVVHKADLGDAELRAVEIQAALAGRTADGDANVVCASTRSGAGLDAIADAVLRRNVESRGDGAAARSVATRAGRDVQNAVRRWLEDEAAGQALTSAVARGSVSVAEAATSALRRLNLKGRLVRFDP